MSAAVSSSESSIRINESMKMLTSSSAGLIALSIFGKPIQLPLRPGTTFQRTAAMPPLSHIDDKLGVKC